MCKENKFSAISKNTNCKKRVDNCSITASYADFESSNVPSVLNAAGTEAINPLYGAAAAANYESPNDIQPYGEVF